MTGKVLKQKVQQNVKKLNLTLASVMNDRLTNIRKNNATSFVDPYGMMSGSEISEEDIKESTKTG